MQLTAAQGAPAPLRITTCTECSGGKFSNLLSGTVRDAQAIRIFFLLFLARALHLFSTKLTDHERWKCDQNQENTIAALCIGDMRSAVIISPVITISEPAPNEAFAAIYRYNVSGKRPAVTYQGYHELL